MKKTRKDYPQNWPEIAQRIKERDNWRCQRCKLQFSPTETVKEVYVGAEPKLRRITVHHCDRNTKNNRDNNLVTLCCACHCKLELPLIKAELQERKKIAEKAKGQQYFF